MRRAKEVVAHGNHHDHSDDVAGDPLNAIDDASHGSSFPQPDLTPVTKRLVHRVGRGLERLLVGAPAPPGNPLFESGERAYLLFPILNILVPQVGQTPCVAGLPFFIVMAFSSFIVRIVRHLIQ